MNIGIIGFGYWGPNLVRNFSSLGSCTVSMVCDLRPERLESVKKSYPAIKTTSNLDDVLENNSIDIILVATPVDTHYDLAKKALLNGKHVLVEKPLTSSVAQAKELIDLALAKNKVLMVDHTFLYTGAVKKIKDLVTNDGVGELRYIDSTRINLGLFQHDVNVLWDLAPHDISICNYISEQKPVSVQAVGVSHTQNNIENIAYLTLHYNSNLIAHFHCSWTSPVKIRQMLIGGDKKMIVYNDMEATEKVKVYDTGYKVRSDEDKKKLLIDYRSGDIYVPKIEVKEALQGMAEDFISAIQNGTRPVSDYNSGLLVVSILEAAEKSIKNKGVEINIVL